MSLGAKIALAVAAFFILVGGSCAASVIGTNNDLVRKEEGIKAQYKQNQNNYDNMWKKFREVSQVPAMYTEDLKKVYDSAIKSRYGEQGSQAMFQWLKEHNPQFDSSMYTKIQSVVEAGRNSFEADQKMLIDKKRVYETQLREFPNSAVASWLGFPKIDLEEYDIVTSEDTEKVFKSKQADEVKLR